jgi:hypothetical protein
MTEKMISRRCAVSLFGLAAALGVLIEHAPVAINQDLQVTFVLEMHPRPTVR